jgi:formylglycine-generating enzyme
LGVELSIGGADPAISSGVSLPKTPFIKIKVMMATAHSHFRQPGADRSNEHPIEPRLIEIPSAWFLMGSASGQDCERPVHRVWVDKFLLAATQVTNAEYERFLRSTGSSAPSFWADQNFNQPEQPVVAVSWFEADRYCSWQSAQTGCTYRLPTEAEWERAARGDFEQKDFPWGDEPPQSLPDYATRWQTGPEPVGRYAPNLFGLYNMCDNVHEWCSDWYDANYYAISPDRNPRGPELAAGKGQRKTSRGGSWRHHIKVARCSARSSIPPEFQYADYGFRVACSL